MESIESIVEQSRLAVVGVAKNCGKTTTLNTLMRWRRDGGLSPPSLMSVGIDGESKDALLGTLKPSIFVQTNQWVVSTGQALQRSSAQVEYVRSLGIETPLGEVFVCRVIEAGTIILAGLRHRHQMVRARRQLEALAPAPIWIDGAYGRVVGAHPELSDAVVIATGMIAGSDIDSVVEQTESLISTMALPVVERARYMELIDRSVAEDRMLLWHREDGIEGLCDRSALAGLRRSAQWWRPGLEAVAIPGLVSNSVAEALLACPGEGLLLIPDCTVIHVDDKLWRRLRQRWAIRVRSAATVVGISYNPTAIGGRGDDGARLARRLRGLKTKVPVFNPLSYPQ